VLIPLTTDRPQRRQPLVTWAIAILNILLFVGMAGMERTDKEGFERLQERLAMDPVAMGLHRAPTGVFGAGGMNDVSLYGQRVAPNGGEWWTLLSYQFVHGGFWHLLGNLLVLWVFGPGIEDRFGKLGFALFYILGGVLAGLTHAVFDASPVIGASGAIAAVTGAFLVLFPRTHIRLLVFFFYIGVFELPAWFFIVFAVAKDVVGLGTHGDEVAFLAHLGGYTFGFFIAMTLLATKLLADEDWSLLAVFRQARRRAEFKRLAAEAEREVGEKMQRPADPVRARTAVRPRVAQSEERVLWQRVDAADVEAEAQREHARAAELRAALSERVEVGDAPGAAAAFQALREAGRAAGGHRRLLMDTGNLLAAASLHADAASAYEAYLELCSGASDPEERRVRLMLALVAHRYLNNRERAVAALVGIKAAFDEPELHLLAQTLREELRPAV